MIIFNPKRKPKERPPTRRAAKSGSANRPSPHSCPPTQAQSVPHLPLRPVPSDPPPYTLDPPERITSRTVAPVPTIQPRPNASASRVAIEPRAIRDGPKPWQPKLPDALHHRISLCDLISSKLDAVITSIDGEVFSGDERELGTSCLNCTLCWDTADSRLAIYEEPSPAIRGGWGSASREIPNRAITSAIVSTNYFTKVNLYANSRLPPHLPELKL